MRWSYSLKRDCVNDNDPLSVSYVLTQAYQMGREGWMIGIESITKDGPDAESFYISARYRRMRRKNGETVKTANRTIFISCAIVFILPVTTSVFRPLYCRLTPQDETYAGAHNASSIQLNKTSSDVNSLSKTPSITIPFAVFIDADEIPSGVSTDAATKLAKSVATPSIPEQKHIATLDIKVGDVINIVS